MRKPVTIGCLLLLLTLSGCINIIEENFLNKDGTGKYLRPFDMSGFKNMRDFILLSQLCFVSAGAKRR